MDHAPASFSAIIIFTVAMAFVSGWTAASIPPGHLEAHQLQQTYDSLSPAHRN